jgi:hypothetical protein
MKAERLVPGISKYPELALQLEMRLERLGAQQCSSCAQSALIREFGRKLKSIKERESMSKGHTKS